MVATAGAWVLAWRLVWVLTRRSVNSWYRDLGNTVSFQRSVGNGIKSGLSGVAQGGGTAPGRGVTVISASHHQEHLGHRGQDDASAPEGRDEVHQHWATAASHLARDSVGLADLVSPVASSHGTMESLAKMMAPMTRRAVATFLEHLTPKLTCLLWSPVAANALNLVH